MASPSSHSPELALGPLLRLIARTYGAHVGFLIGTAVVIVTPTALFDVLSVRFADDVDLEGSLALVLAGTFGSTVVFIGGSVGHQLYTGLITSTVAATREGLKRPTLAELWPGLPIVTLVGADIVYSVGVGIAFFLLIVPGIVVATWYALVAPVIDLEQLSLRRAFKRSRELVLGHFWTVLGIVALFVGGSELLTALIVDAAGADSLIGKWSATIAADLIVIPLYGVAIATTAIEFAARKPPAAR